jgi:hypothetical protein
MKIGRNQPCPCGSGKKYKKCCLGKPDDEQAASSERAQLMASAESATAGLSEDVAGGSAEEKDRWAEFWEEYEVAGLDPRLEMAKHDIEESDGLDGDLAFELVEGVAAACQEDGRTTELEDLIGNIEKRTPKAFASESYWFHSWRVENALLSGGDLETPLMALAAEADRGIDQLFRIVDRLLYHCREAELRHALEIAWPPVRDSHDIMEHSKVELQDLALLLSLLDHLDRNDNLDATDDGFLSATKEYPRWVRSPVVARRHRPAHRTQATHVAADRLRTRC